MPNQSYQDRKNYKRDQGDNMPDEKTPADKLRELVQQLIGSPPPSAPGRPLPQEAIDAGQQAFPSGQINPIQAPVSVSGANTISPAAAAPSPAVQPSQLRNIGEQMSSQAQQDALKRLSGQAIK